MKIDNRGQSLVLFVLMLPVILLILVMVIDIGKMVLYRQEINNINKLAIFYGLDKIDDNPEDLMREIIRQNNEEIVINKIEISTDRIEVLVEVDVKFILFKNNDLVKIKSNYVGYMENGKKVVKGN